MVRKSWQQEQGALSHIVSASYGALSHIVSTFYGALSHIVSASCEAIISHIYCVCRNVGVNAQLDII